LERIQSELVYERTGNKFGIVIGKLYIYSNKVYALNDVTGRKGGSGGS